MAKKINEFSILQPLAKELGYKNADELKEALGKEEVGRGTRGAMGNIGGAGGAGTGFLGGREVGSGFGVGIKKRLAGGQGLGQSVAGGFKDFKETLSLGNIKKRALEKTFGGPGFISAFARGKLKKKYAGEKSPTKEGDEEEQKGGEKGGGGGDASSYLGILAKSALVLPGMARDTNVLRQNLQKLVKIFAGPQEKGKKAYATKSDFKPSPLGDSSTGQVLNDSEKERSKDIDFFAAEDKKEADLEASKQKKEAPVAAAPTAEKKDEDGGGLLGTIIDLIKNGLMKGLKKLFNPKVLMKALGKVFVIGAIIGSLFSGIVDGFKKYQETGSLFDAYKAFLGGILNFLTFGLLGEEEVNSFFDAIGNFLEPLIDGIKGIYYTVKDWIVNNVGIPKIKVAGIPFGPYYPFKSNPTSEEPEFSNRPIKAKEDKDLQKSGAKAPSGSSMPGGEESSSPTPDIGNQPKALMTLSGESVKLPSGALFDNESKSLIYKGVSIPASKIGSQDEMDKIVQAIDNKSVVEYQGKDDSGAPVTKTINGATGEIGVTPPKQPTPVAPPAAAPAGGGGGGGGGREVSASSAGGEQASSPSELAATPPESGSELSDASAEIAEAQRMESSADMGSSVDASSTNNSSGSTGGSQPKIADVYDTEFANLYAMA